MDERQRRLLEYLFAAAWADGQVDERDKTILDRVMVSVGIPREKIMELIPRVEASPQGEPQDVPEDPALRQEMMLYSLALCFSDEALVPTETEYLQRLAARLSITADQLVELRNRADVFLNPDKALKAKLTAPSAEAKAAPKAVSLERSDQVAKPPAEGGHTIYRGDSFGQSLDFGTPDS
ncbi:MAG: DUF533 domain-containing protein [Candidatus Eremiobacteraeota bacterium]|nr:DUF533 domain-containing protein [Candidatus Eremiobacteraeota bacterium]